MKKIAITDHALVQFLQRGGRIDMTSLRLQMQEGLARAASVAGALGQSNFTVKCNGLTYVIVDGVCVTVLDRADKPYVVREASR